MIKNICKVYSKISLKEIANLMNLSNLNDAEFMISKAIAEKEVEGKIENGVFVALPNKSVYKTHFPIEKINEQVSDVVDLTEKIEKEQNFPFENFKVKKSFERKIELEKMVKSFNKSI
ncbi:26S proteasome non-ATPase regulatory subunit 3 [Bonamia ostreae]|uniref:26S proteasome non-ATPase regulatory subunit 3 n=1 Tax=Bonamia ostreae TaxID=126728 RepID=A0ABV2ATK0_9EUKA